MPPGAHLSLVTLKLRASGKARGGFTSSTRILKHTGDFLRWIGGADSIVVSSGYTSDMTWPAPSDASMDFKLAAAQTGIQNHYLFGRPLRHGMAPRPVAAINHYDATVLRKLTHEWLKAGL